MRKTFSNAGNAYQLYRSRRLVLPMIGDALRGRYRFSLFTLIVLVLCLAYVLFPLDMLPDFIPFVGWIDDGVLIYLLLQQLKKETVRYQQWRTPRPDPFHPSLFQKNNIISRR